MTYVSKFLQNNFLLVVLIRKRIRKHFIVLITSSKITSLLQVVEFATIAYVFVRRSQTTATEIFVS